MKKLRIGAIVVVSSGLLVAAVGCSSGDETTTTGVGGAGGASGAGGAAGLDSGSAKDVSVDSGGAGGGTADSSTDMSTGSGGGDGTGTGGAAGSAGAGGAAGTGGAGGAGGTGMCRPVGDTCASSADCCSVSCDTVTRVCTVPGQCKPGGGSCTIPQDCCTFVCDNGVCGGSQCTSDNQACSSSAQCCSGNCSPAGLCAPLNPSCRTNGNACSTGADCCSKMCRNGLCSPGSYCTQNGDVCAADAECCGGLCAKQAGANVGLCGQPMPPGTPGCTVAGQACGESSTSDGGPISIDGGVPACGGDCCSRACAPYQGRLFICQPPSGCRPTGEVCRTDADCCGFGGVQGQTGTGNCSKTNPTDPVGRCDNGNACRPAGAICKLATSSCNAENNCCAGNVNQNPFVCQQDILGIPRCTMSGMPCSDAGVKTGQACSTSADCCGLPCVPNPNFTPDAGAGVPPFVCGGICVAAGGSCTTTADCCRGLPCTMPPGSTRGICGQPPPPDGGVPDGSTPPPDVTPPDPDATPPDPDATPPDPDATPPDPDAAPPPDDVTPPPPDADGGPPCAEYGQVCTTSGDCCNGIPCNGGRCIIIPK